MWLRVGEAKRIEQLHPQLLGGTADGGTTVGVLAHVRLSDGELTLTTSGRIKFDFARELLVAYFGDKLELVDEQIVPIEEMIDRAGAPDGEVSGADDIPPDVQAEVKRDFYQKRYRRFLDEPVPMIENMTPREAARDPSMRPKLIELIKLHLNTIDAMNADEGLGIDVDWILDELGLDELR